MKRIGTAELETVLAGIAPELDRALTTEPVSDYLNDDSKQFSPELVRRSGACMFSSWVLQKLLKEEGISTKRYYKMFGQEVYGPTHIDEPDSFSGHVLLKMSRWGDGRAIDPTPQQFFWMVGLHVDRASTDSRLTDFYPDDNTIAVIKDGDTSYADNFAEQAHWIDQRIDEFLPDRQNRPDLPLVNTTIDQKVAVYRQVWGIDTYHRFRQPGWANPSKAEWSLGRSAAKLQALTSC